MSGLTDTKENQPLGLRSQVSFQALAELPQASDSLRGESLSKLASKLELASHSTINALKGKLDPKERSFREKLQENLNGGAAFFRAVDDNKFKYTARALISLSLAGQFLLSCVPIQVVVAPIKIPQDRAIATEVVSTATATPTETASPTPTEVPLPAEFTDLQERLGETAKLHDTGEKDPEGNPIMAMYDQDGNIIESVRSYADGTTSFVYDDTDLTIASIVVEKSSDGELAQLGPWHVEDGAIIIDTAPAPKTVEDAAKFPKLAYLEGVSPEKQKAIDFTIHKYVQMATAETAASEFENIYVDGKKIDLVAPTVWQSSPLSYAGIKAVSISAPDGSRYINDEPIFIALKHGYYNFEIYDVSGKQTQDIVGIPIVVRNPDQSIVSMTGLVNRSELPKMLEFMTIEKRGDLLPLLLKTVGVDDHYDANLFEKSLQEFVFRRNQEFFDKDVLEDEIMQLPQELSTTGFWLFTIK